MACENRNMSDFIPKPGTVKIGGLSRAAQKLQAAKDKAAGKTGAKGHANTTSMKATGTLTGAKKASFQRKSV